MVETVLIVADDPAQLSALEYTLQQTLGYRTITASHGEEALEWLLSYRQPRPALLLLDLSSPHMNGLHLTKTLRAYKSQLPIIVMTSFGDEEGAQAAMEAGASDYLVKPAAVMRLRLALRTIFQTQRMRDYITCLERKSSDRLALPDITGISSVMKEMLIRAEQAASTKMPLWITGEAGSGKELLARAIHGSGDRAGKPFIVMNCNILPEECAQAVLFGQENQPGVPHMAFGKLREAERGTLLLKHVDRLPLSLQQRLIEVLENGTVKLLNGVGRSPVDVRIICATTELIEPLIAQGRFSHTLYRRLGSLPIAVPPLRDRKEDLPLLCQRFVRDYSASEHKYIHGVTEAALQSLGQSHWPDNIRQLAQVLWRAVILCDQDMIDTVHIQLVQKAPSAAYPVEWVDGGPALFDMHGRIKKLKSIEEEAIRLALRYSDGCMTRAARNLGIGRSTLYRRVNELRLEDYMARENQTIRPMMKVSSMDRS